MGLFSTVLHVRSTPREELLPALDAVLRDDGFARTGTLPVPTDGPYALPDHRACTNAHPYYFVSTPSEHWLTIIEAHFGVRGIPHICDVSNRLSGALHCYTLALAVHDDDLFFYNLERNGVSLDGYNSCPQYFEQKRVPDPKIEDQRHRVRPFQPLLPTGRSIRELQSLLDRGWWNAFDSGKLDEFGVARGDHGGFVFEGERMTAFGNLLRLHGTDGDYPFTAWGESRTIHWPEFVAVRYDKAA
jgi:hypothetical protein